MTSLLDVKNLSMHFPIRGGLFKRQVGTVYAVNDISFHLEEGETFGIVGESGCGKSTLGRTIVRIYEPSSGVIHFRGQNMTHLNPSGLKGFRKEIQMVFQDPYASLNPRKPIFNILEEPFLLHGLGDATERRKQVAELMQLVGLRRTDMNKFPHEFSGGQRQRIGIARALALRPSLVVCDEAVSALDVSIQAQIINLLIDLQKRFKLTYIFISHDLNVVRYISDRVAVMYLGRFMEVADAATMYEKPAHPYTRALLAAAPKPDPRRTNKPVVLEGDVPSPSRPPRGCPFHTRCPYVVAICKEQLPALLPLGMNTQQLVACHRAQELNTEASHS